MKKGKRKMEKQFPNASEKENNTVIGRSGKNNLKYNGARLIKNNVRPEL